MRVWVCRASGGGRTAGEGEPNGYWGRSTNSLAQKMSFTNTLIHLQRAHSHHLKLCLPRECLNNKPFIQFFPSQLDFQSNRVVMFHVFGLKLLSGASKTAPKAALEALE